MFLGKLAIQSISLAIERPLGLNAVFAAVTCDRELEIQHLTLDFCCRSLRLPLAMQVRCSMNSLGVWEGLCQEGFNQTQ